MSRIWTRRSIRQYSRQPVSDDAIRQILKAAMSAPSAYDRRPWSFVVITDEQILREIPRFHEYAIILNAVGTAIAVCGVTSAVDTDEEWLAACSAATQNMLLAAHELGLGSVWVGITPIERRVEKLKALLELPAGIEPICVLPLGYPAEERHAEDRYDESKVHMNRWSSSVANMDC
jgi:nitroreductase